eukprot:6478091-Pyramimonas_sp.AAC.1
MGARRGISISRLAGAGRGISARRWRASGRRARRLHFRSGRRPCRLAIRLPRDIQQVMIHALSENK